MDYSPEDINRHYVAMGHSVSLINDIIAGTVQSEDPRQTIASNQAHLESMVAKDIWDGYDLADINAVLAIDSETVEIMPYREQGTPLSELIGREVTNRIFAHASANTQMNMTGAATAGLLSEDEMEAYKQGLVWVSQMRAKGVELIENEVDDYHLDSHWPEPSVAAVTLANAL